ncbi:hypothetical protein DL93DRAFT_2154881 [Clavulina sp. PMI_390]|nr:hypothetical protein DL93DRAFT_2154881 [Clavulina sp. PMI_390]
MCEIQTNPDAAGVGVQASVYIQAFLPLISMMIAICRGESLVENVRLHEQSIILAKTSLLTAVAIIISAIVQSHKYGLSVFDALIVLNLCWIAVIGGFTPMLSAMMSLEHLRREDHHRPDHSIPLTAVPRKLLNGFLNRSRTVEWNQLLYCSFAIISGFGLWVMHNPMTFDRSPDSCTSTTVFWIMGHSVNVTSSRFRTALLTIYALFMVPFLGFVLLAIVWALIYTPIRFLTLRLIMLWRDIIYPHLSSHQSSDSNLGATHAVTGKPNYVWLQLLRPIPFVVLIVILILTTQKTMQVNNLGSEDRAWGLGQISALLIAIFAAVSVLWEFKRPQNHGEDNTEGQEMNRREGAGLHNQTRNDTDIEWGEGLAAKNLPTSIQENRST